MKFEPDLKVSTIRESDVSQNFKKKYKSYNDFKIKFKEEKKDVIFSNIFSVTWFSVIVLNKLSLISIS